MSRYTSATDADRQAMLDTIGAGSVDELFADVPEGVRLGRPLDLAGGLPEQDVIAYLKGLAARNVSADDEITFAGGGMYDHYVPALVDHIVSRSEFLTPYTPYQPEVSQGGLQVMFEFQTMISELTGLPVANASVYEGPSAVAAAVYMARTHNRRSRVVMSQGVHPHSRETVRSTGAGWGMTFDEVPLSGGATDLEALRAAIDDGVSSVVLAQPNFVGAVEDLEALAEVAKATGATLIVQADPIALGILAAPGDQGADVVVGEGQPLGNRLDFGGPSFGFYAATQEYLRRMPGRIAGETTDADGRRGFVLTLQTREQHIRREKATSNICTAQALNALAGTIYLSWLGRRGLVELCELLVQRTAYAREVLAAIDGVGLLHGQPVVREFAVRLDAPVERVIERCAEAGVNPGLPLGDDGLLVAITELRTRAHIDRLAEVLGAAVAAVRSEVEVPA